MRLLPRHGAISWKSRATGVFQGPSRPSRGSPQRATSFVYRLVVTSFTHFAFIAKDLNNIKKKEAPFLFKGWQLLPGSCKFRKDSSTDLTDNPKKDKKRDYNNSWDGNIRRNQIIIVKMLKTIPKRFAARNVLALIWSSPTLQKNMGIQGCPLSMPNKALHGPTNKVLLRDNGCL